ncbi:MAG TPA: Mu-like prophage major head subunit gpT family protein [Verrucomicrobiae bacterium]|nr:Mu-like prophage major head subunit gpT family protein [Verrucomicrobiae bacterium]
MLATAENLRELYRNNRVQYMEGYHGGKPEWPRFAIEVPSSTKEQAYNWLAAFPGMKEFLGEMVVVKLGKHRYAIINRPWYDTVAIPQDDIEDDTYGVHAPRFKALGEVAATHPDELIAQLLIDAFDPVKGLDYTGSAFFAENKEPIEKERKFSNMTTKKLSRDNFRAARQSLRERTNPFGRSLNLGVKLVLVVTPADESLGKEILVADNIDKGNAGVTNVDKGDAELFVWNQLSAVSPATWRPWFLLELGKSIKPLILQMRQRPDVYALDDMTADHVFKNHEFLYQAWARYNAGFGLPELAYGSKGTTAA